MNDFVVKIARELSVKSWQVQNTLDLLKEGATIPFISRYRKEKSGGLEDIQIIEIENLNKKYLQLTERKKTVLNSLREQGVLSDELRQRVEEAGTINEVEDVYLPFRPKRKTRATLAKAKGLEPLAKMIMSENLDNPVMAAQRFISVNNQVLTVEDALAGARDIIAEWVSEKDYIRKRLRNLFERESTIKSNVAKGKEEEAEKYRNYFDWEEKVNKAPSHRILAMLRGEEEGYLKVKCEPELSVAIEMIEKYLVKENNSASEQKKLAIRDAVRRLLFPAMETELRASLKQRADTAAIRVFSENLRQLLLSPPLGQKNVLAIDPGFRTGCKIVCLDKNGLLMANETIYPHPPQRETGMAIKKLKSLVNAYKIEAIAIGNGTAGRETEELLKKIEFDRELVSVMVNENGASVYSASSLAREEFPDFDVTVRGAVSIGRRLMDPLAELVKIDPKSIGVGQYQHDVNQKLLQESLQSTVEICVNKVGVELNTASKELLTYVSGIGPSLAAKIVNYRNQHGDFLERNDLLKVKGLGEKAFEQSAGFLRIRNGINPLDSSAVHPENYSLVKKMIYSLQLPLNEVIGNKKAVAQINPENFVGETIGLPTISDILSELEKPGRDPRSNLKMFEFDKRISTIADLQPGMLLPGIVANLTAFGAFVDIGIHESGLIHKSQIANEFVENPADYLRLNQTLTVKVLEVDITRKRISLSLLGIDK